MVVRRPNRNRGKSVVRYPWDKWFAADKFTVRRGEHYSCAVHGMAAMIRNVASQRNMRVSLSITEEGTITVRVVSRGDK